MDKSSGHRLLDPAILPFVSAHELGPLSIEGMRAAALRIAQSARPPVVGKVTDRHVSGPNGAVPIRVYEPLSPTPAGLLIYLHGSGWVVGNLDSHDHIARALCATSDFIVAAVDYRVAPEHKFPAAVLDVEAATCWLLDHAPMLGCDQQRVAILGESAGGNLAAVVVQRLSQRQGPRLAAQVLAYAATDFQMQSESVRVHEHAPLLTAATVAWCRDQYLNGPQDIVNPDASPMLHPDVRNCPPAFIMTAEIDPLRDDGELYAQRLVAAGVPVLTRRYLGLPHGFLAYPISVPCIHAAFDDIRRALRYLLPRQALLTSRAAGRSTFNID